jgi:Tfp pilus assembly major pilin PilA
MMRRRSSAVMLTQPPISASVRPQPMQSPQVASTTHTLVHGVSMEDGRSISAIRLGDALAARVGAAIDSAIIVIVAALTS